MDTSFPSIVRLGEFLRDFTAAAEAEGGLSGDSQSLDESFLEKVVQQNAWFTRKACLYSFKYWGEMLREESLSRWLAPYPDPKGKSIKVALILAGNIPLVGLHDFLSVLLTGNQALVKCASNDRLLMPSLAERLIGFAPELEGRIRFTEGRLGEFDAVIATGSNNTSRYFEYYFSKKPHVIRKNRNGVAVLTGNESFDDLKGLGADVFRYFGMGCRSISKVFVPEGYDFDLLFRAFYDHKDIINHQKYANNYDYNKAIYLMSGSEMLDNGFLLLKEDSSIGSPIGTLFYETYTSATSLGEKLQMSEIQLQCIIGGKDTQNSIPFGKAQWPELSDYADGVDTIDFLLKNSAN